MRTNHMKHLPKLTQVANSMHEVHTHQAQFTFNLQLLAGNGGTRNSYKWK